jgi:hypothetical protein
MIDFREITTDGRSHFNYFKIEILDLFCTRLCRFNCDPISFMAHLLLKFFALFFKNVHSFNFITKVTNQEYFKELCSRLKYYVHLLTSSYYEQILSLSFFGNLSISRTILLCIIAFISVIKGL